MYRGHSITLYPHALGWRGGKQVLLALTGSRGRGDTEHGAPPWEWICVRDLRTVVGREGCWRTADRPPSHLLDLIEAISP